MHSEPQKTPPPPTQCAGSDRPGGITSSGFQGHWGFSLALAISYLAIFNLWKLFEPTGIVASGLAVCALLAWLLVRAARKHYFVNRWDAVLHGVVVLDILLEATLIPAHQTRGFYWCALAFALVIGGYRAHMLRRHRRMKMPFIARPNGPEDSR